MSPRKPPPGQRSETSLVKEAPPSPFALPQPRVSEPALAVSEPPFESAAEPKTELKSTPGSVKPPSADASIYGTPIATAAPTPPAETSPEASVEEEETRPGLGPMIKPKAQRDIAGTLWKAASAAAAFKPRPGGAGERLRELTKKASTEPDGITGVVPAPPRPIPAPEPIPPVEPLKLKEADEPHALPEVKVTVPNSSRPTSLQASAQEAKRKSMEPPRKEDKSEELIVTGNDAKYLAALGIDMSLLADTMPQFAGWLDHFGWVPGERMRTRNVEEMRVDIERELNKAQAGGWIARFKEEDERVDAIKKGLDVAISECEELDNLLTLYSVELSVSDNEKTTQVNHTNTVSRHYPTTSHT